MALAGHVDEISRSVIQGWAFDIGRPDEAVSISIFVDGVPRGMCLTRHPRSDLILPNGDEIAGNYGFHFAFEPPLSPFVELHIDVVETWSAQALPNGSWTLPRPRPGGGDGAGIMPILVTSTGRTGTTLLMSEFVRHPNIVAGDRLPYEIKQIAYYSAAFRALAADADRERSTSPDTMLGSRMHHIIGSNPYNKSGLFGLGGSSAVMLRDFYQSTVPSGYVTLFRRFILEFYATLAAAQGKQAASYFCEKSDIDEAAVQGARLFFDAVKDIVIVRDPRDLLCSAIAFWKLSPETAMVMLETTIPQLSRIARHAGPDTIVIRYEDLVREPVSTRQALSRFLDLDLLGGGGAEVEAIPDSHRTSRDPAASIGRWRNDLTPDQIDACEMAFASYMHDFDYETSERPSGGAGSHPDRLASSGNEIVAAEGALAVAELNEQTVIEGEDGLLWRHVFELVFGLEGSGETSTQDGWSDPERGYVWSNATESLLRLPPIRREGDYRLSITAAPFTAGTVLPAQRVTVLLDGQEAGSARVRYISVLRVPVPGAAVGSGKPFVLTLRFPDAARPSDILGIRDTRVLGFSLQRITLFRAEPAAIAAEPAAMHPGRRSPAWAGPGSHTGAADHNLENGRGRSTAFGESDGSVASRVIEVSRKAFRRPELEYHSRTMLLNIPGYDSTRFVLFVLALEAEFGIVLLEEEVDSIVTLGDIVALLRGKGLDTD